jgi:hypothetical protein
MTAEVVIGAAIIQTILSVLIAIFSWYRYRQRDRLMILVGLLFAFSAFFNTLQFTALFIRKNYIMNAIGSVYEIIFFLIASLIYDHVTHRRYRLFILLIASFLALGGMANIFFSSIGLASATKLASHLVVVTYCIVYFFQLMRDLPTIHLHRLPMFWINSAFLLYCAGTIFVTAFIEYAIKVHVEKMPIIWLANLSLFILHQVIIMVAVVYDFTRQKSPDLHFKAPF